MAQWIDFLQDKNGDTVYPVGVTSGIFLPNGKKLSVWTNKVEKDLKEIGVSGVIHINPNQWEYNKYNDTYECDFYDCYNPTDIDNADIVLPNSFANLFLYSSNIAEEEQQQSNKYIWFPYIPVSKYEYEDRKLESKLIDNANKYVKSVYMQPHHPFNYICIAFKRPPYDVYIKIVSLAYEMDKSLLLE